MVRLVVSLVILVIVLVIRLIVWLVEQSKKSTLPPPLHGYGPPPGQGPPGWGPLGSQGPGGMPGGPMQGGYPQGGHGAAGGPQAGGYQQQGGYGAPGGGQPLPQLAAGGLRLLVRPDCNFERVAACMSHAGLRLAAPPGPAQQPGEPSSALWQNEPMQVMYSFDARTYLRAVQIQGPSAEHLRQHLVGVAGLPALDGPQVFQMLQSQRPADQMLGLAAAEVLGAGPDARHYLGAVGVLSGHPNPEIAGAARRVQQILQSQVPHGA